MTGFHDVTISSEAHMAEVHAFRAYRYDANRVALEDVLTQPYDKITPAMQEGYYARSPYMRTEQVQEASDVLRTPHGHDGNTFGIEVPTPALSQGFKRELVADPFNQHDRLGEEEGRGLRAIEVGVERFAIAMRRLHSRQSIESQHRSVQSLA